MILVKSSDIAWLQDDQHRMRDVVAVAKDGKNRWVPLQNLPFREIILFAYAADRSSRPTYVCLPSGLHNARNGRVVPQSGPQCEITPLPGIFFFDAWRTEPILNIPPNLPSTQDAPDEATLPSAPASPRVDQAKAHEEEARDIMARAVKNQADDGPSTRKAAIRAYKYLYTLVKLHGPQIQEAYDAAKLHASCSRGTSTKTDYRPPQQDLPAVTPELTSELLHCLSTLPDPWPPAKITINMDSASQWVSKMTKLFFADAYVRHEVGPGPTKQLPQKQTALQAVQNVLPELETRVTEFLAEWLVALLMPAKHVLETRSPHLSFMLHLSVTLRCCHHSK